VFGLDDIWLMMNQVIAPGFSTGQPICKAGIDLALFDLAGRILDKNAGERWGRAAGEPVAISWTLDPKTLDNVAAGITEATTRGFRHFNVKVRRDSSFDLAVCREIRRLAPAAFVWVDANGGYDLSTAPAVAPKLKDLGIAALEQPLPANQLSGYRKLVRQKTLPILMDEGVVSLTDLETFHQFGLLNGMTMKVSRSGGLSESRRMIDYLQGHGLHFFASGLTDPDIAFAACLQLYSAFNLPHPAALNAPQFLKGTYLKNPIRIIGAQAFPPPGPGLGVEVDETILLAAGSAKD